MKTGLTVLEWVTQVALLLARTAVAFGKGCPVHAEECTAPTVPNVVDASHISAEDRLGSDSTIEGTTGSEVTPQTEAAQRRARRLAEVRERAGAEFAQSVRLNEVGLYYHMTGRRPEGAAAFLEALALAVRSFGNDPETAIVLAWPTSARWSARWAGLPKGRRSSSGRSSPSSALLTATRRSMWGSCATCRSIS